MYEGIAEAYFHRDEKTISRISRGNEIYDLKRNMMEEITREAQLLSMLPGEVIITFKLEKDGEYVDSDEHFAEYDGKSIILSI